MEFGKKTKNTEVHGNVIFFFMLKVSKYGNTVKMNKNKAKTIKTKLCICQKSGSNFFSVFMRASVAMCFKYSTVLKYTVFSAL